MKKFVADKEFWDIFPEAVIGVISFDNVQESKELVGAEADEVKKILDDANVEAKKFLVSDTISENPVVAAWREAYGNTFGQETWSVKNSGARGHKHVRAGRACSHISKKRCSGCQDDSQGLRRCSRD